MITPFSKFDNAVLRGVLRGTDANVVSDQIFNCVERDAFTGPHI